MQNLPEKAHQKLAERMSGNAFRRLRHYNGKHDFSSNDYLGFSKHPFLLQHVSNRLSEWACIGSGGSRLLTGNHPAFEQLEKRIATFHQSETALFFGSGYEANSGLIPALASKGDTILYDSLCHASLREGIRLSFARSIAYVHNDLIDLEKKLHTSEGELYVISESVFSMDGDLCPLPGLIKLCEQYGARLILDEAHGTGVVGERGVGLAQKFQLQDKIFARIHTFGKALGVQGAAILGSEALKDYLVNFCRPFIFTTAPSLPLVAAVEAAYILLEEGSREVADLQELIKFMDQLDRQVPWLGRGSAIRTLVVPGNEHVRLVAEKVQKEGYLVLPVLAPTVPEGSERLRICLHADHSTDLIENMMRVVEKSMP
jgi:8-amino-7-oxononanoate synthase